MRSFGSVIFLILVLLAPSVHGDNTGKIVGRVVDASTGNPLPYVNVWIPDVKMGAVSEISGDYCLIGVPPGDYTVRAMIMGYAHLETTNVRVVAGQTTALDLSLWFRGWGGIGGRVVYSGSTDGIPFAKVHIFPTNHRVLRLKADRLGYYQISYVPSGVCSVRASHGLFESQTVSMHVAAGETVSVDFNLCPKRGGFGIITGVVTDSVTGKPLSAASITRILIPLYNTDDFESVRSDTSGKYDIPGAFAGTHMLVASRQGYTTTRIADVLVEADEVSEVNLSLRPHPLPDTLGRICGIVVDASTCEPLPYANLYIHDAGQGGNSDLFGFYCIRNVRPGTHAVTARYIGHTLSRHQMSRL